jgi:hypothetical protein
MTAHHPELPLAAPAPKPAEREPCPHFVARMRAFREARLAGKPGRSARGVR